MKSLLLRAVGLALLIGAMALASATISAYGDDSPLSSSPPERRRSHEGFISNFQ